MRLKIPQWLLRVLFGSIVSAVVAALLLLSTAWPDRNLDVFLGMISAGRNDEARKWMTLPEGWTIEEEGSIRIVDGSIPHAELYIADWRSCFEPSRMKAQPRSVTDVLLARRRYHSSAIGIGPRKTVRETLLFQFNVQIPLTLEISTHMGGISINSAQEVPGVVPSELTYKGTLEP